MRFKVSSLTIAELKQLIALGDDNYANQIRVTKDGYVFLSREIVGAENIENILYRFETFDAHNNYVGVEAANDETYIRRLYKTIVENWPIPRSTYIDFWN